MLDKEERDSIINEAVEKALLLLPQTVGSLMANQAALFKLNKEFYEKYPDFAGHKQVVAAVLEKVDGDIPLASLEEKYEKAVPLIRERLKTIGSLEMKTATEPKRTTNGVF